MSSEAEVKHILLTVLTQRRGLEVDPASLEQVYGPRVGSWYALRRCVTDEAALEEARKAVLAGEAERVRVIISVRERQR